MVPIKDVEAILNYKERRRKRLEGRRFDAEEVRWITTRTGAHIPLDEEGTAVGGPLKGEDFGKAESTDTGKEKRSGPRAPSRIGYKKSALDSKQRDSYNAKFEDLAERMTEANARCEAEKKHIEKDQKGVPYSKRDFSKLWAEQKKRKETGEEYDGIIKAMPIGALLSGEGMLYEKTAGGWLVRGAREDYNSGEPLKEEEFIRQIKREDYRRPLKPLKCIESTNDLKMVQPIELKSDEKYKDFADAINGLDKKGVVEKAKADPEFKELVDAITLYTQGAYGDQKKEARYLVEHGLEEAELTTVGDYFGDGAYEMKQLWNGQKLAESKSSFSGGVLSMIGAINNSEETGNELYRIADDRSIMDSLNEIQSLYTPPKVGDRIKMDAPTSFAKDRAVMSEISGKKYGDTIRYTLEPGAKALDIENLSHYKGQKEMLTCGEYEVVDVAVSKSGAGVRTITKDSPKFDLFKDRIIKERATPDGGTAYDVCAYSVKVTIRQVGKTEIGKRNDAKISYCDCKSHFDGRTGGLPRADEDEDDGRWITTENGHKVHLNEEGEPDKGNPHVIEAMEGSSGSAPKHNIKNHEDAKKHREKIVQMKASAQRAEKTIKRCEAALKEAEEKLRGNKENLEAAKELYKNDLEGTTYEDAKKLAEEKLAEIEDVRKEKRKYTEKHMNGTMTPEEHEVWKKIDDELEQLLDAYDFRYSRAVTGFETVEFLSNAIKENEKTMATAKEIRADAEKEQREAPANIERATAEYNAYFEERNRKTLERIKDAWGVKTSEDATDYLIAKGYFRGDPMEVDESVDLNAMQSSCAFEVVRRTDEYIKDYPFLKGELGGMACRELPDNNYALVLDGDNVVYSEKWYSDPFTIAESYDGSWYHPKGTEYDSITDHELTHVAEYVLNKKLGGRRASDIVMGRVAKRRFDLDDDDVEAMYEEYPAIVRASVSAYSADNRGTKTDPNTYELVNKGYGMNTEFLAESVSGARCSDSPNETIKMAYEEYNKLVREVFG